MAVERGVCTQARRESDVVKPNCGAHRPHARMAVENILDDVENPEQAALHYRLPTMIPL